MKIPQDLFSSKVLLVDDEINQLEVLAQVLKLHGLLVTIAQGPCEALHILAETVEKFELAVLDYHMPLMNGCALADRLRSMCPELRIILHSGTIDISQQEMTNVNVFVPKSEGIETLLAEITQQLTGFAPQPQSDK